MCLHSTGGTCVFCAAIVKISMHLKNVIGKKREREGDGRHNSTGTPGGTVLRSHRGDLCFFAAIEKNSMHLKTVIGKK